MYQKVQEACSQLIFRSFHSRALLFALDCKLLSPKFEAPIWLAWTKFSLWKLDKLLPSSSALPDDETSDGAISEVAAVRPDLFFFISSVICSEGKASRMLSVTVGSSSSAVIVQSSWFCVNRRRKLRQVNKSLISHN